MWDILKKSYSKLGDLVLPIVGGAIGGTGIQILEDYTENHAASQISGYAASKIADRKTDSVLSVEKTADFILNEYENTLDLRNKDELNSAVAASIGVDLRDTDEELKVKNSSLASYIESKAIHSTLFDIKARMESFSGDLSVFKEEIIDELGGQLSDLNTLMTNQHGEVIGFLGDISNQIANTSTLLGGEIGKNQAMLAQLIANDAQAAIEARQRQLEQAIEADRQAYFQLGITLLSQIDPKIANEFAVVTNASIKIYDAIQGFSKLDKLGDLGTGVLTMNMVDAALSIVGLFADQPSSEQIIMQQIAELQKQIADLRVEMNERFDIVDQKLNDILTAVDHGFQMVQGQLNTTLNAVVTNTQIGINTQALLLAEVERITNLVRDFFLVPCIDWQANTKLDLPDSDFVTCALLMRQYALNTIKGDQLAYNTNWTGSELENFLATNEGRMTDVLYTIFINRTGIFRNTDIMVSPEQWYMASSWYRDFLLDSPDQVLRTGLDYDALSRIAQVGREISDYRAAVLNTFINHDTAQFGWPSYDIVDKGNNLIAYIKQSQSDGETSYFNRKGFFLNNIDSPLNPLANVGNNYSWYQVPTQFTQQVLSGVQAGDILNNVPNVIKVASANGMGDFSISLRFVSTQTIFDVIVCGGIYTCAIYDNWVADVYFEPNTDGLTRFKVGHMNFKIGGSPRRCDLGFNCHQEWPDFCYSEPFGYNGYVSYACLSAGIREAFFAGGLIVNSGYDTQQLIDEFERHRQGVANEIINILDPLGSNPTSFAIEDNLKWENAYFSALVKFAFNYVIDESDGLYGLASRCSLTTTPCKASPVNINGKGGIPLLSYLVGLVEGNNYGETWLIDEFVQSEVNALDTYFRSDAIKQWGEAAKLDPILSQVTDVMVNTKVYLDDYTMDTDQDGIRDAIDNCKLIPNPGQNNYDGDGAGDACDPDDDNDGMPDSYELMKGFNPFNPSDASDDADGDGYSNLDEYKARTDPRDPESIPKAKARFLPWLPLLLE